MSDKPMPSKTSEMQSSISLDTLNRLEKKAKMMKETSLTRVTKTPSNGLRESRGDTIRTPGNKAAFDQFEEAHGGRAGLIDTLSLAQLDKKQEHFLNLLSDPIRERDNLATIARDAGLVPSQILALFREASFAKAHAISLAQLTESVPAIVGDLTAKALDAVISCPECLGTGNGIGTEECDKCKGRGEVMRIGDLDHKKIALEIGGLLKKGGGVNVQVQQNNVTATAPGGFFSRFVKSSDADAYNIAADVIEAEEVKE